MGLFPYAKPRAGQAEFLEDAREAMREEALLLAQAPTGLGKTAVALAATLECASERGKKVLFTTCRRSQHRIAIDTLRLIVRDGFPRVTDIIAREAMCTDHEPHTTSGGRSRVAPVAKALLREVLHVQEVMDLARRFDVCPHEAALAAARRTDVLVCDYTYLFSPHRSRILRYLGIGLEDIIVVVDEAHNLPSRSREALSSRVTTGRLELLVRTLRSGSAAAAMASLARALRSESRVVGGDSRVPVDFLDRLLTRYVPGYGGGHPSKKLARTLHHVVDELPVGERLLMEEVLDLLRKWRRPDFLRVLSPNDGGTLSLVSLDPRPATRKVFEGIHAALLMSGTLHPGEMYVEILGIRAERSMVRSYLPDFPPENRLLVASRNLSSSYKERPESFVSYAREIQALCRAIPGNVAAFFPSYEMAREVGRILQRIGPPKAMVWERRGQTKAEKEGILMTLELGRETGGRLMMGVQGASLSEGIDYPGNLLRAVIVAGLALNPPQIEVQALRSFYSRRFGRRKGYEYAYLYPALNRLVQCGGRCIRGPEDVAAVVVLDNRLLRPFYSSRLPRGFHPAAPRDLVGSVRSFFYERQPPKVGADQERGGSRSKADGMDGPEGGGEEQAPQGLPARPARREPEELEDESGGPSLQGG